MLDEPERRVMLGNSPKPGARAPAVLDAVLMLLLVPVLGLAAVLILAAMTVGLSRSDTGSVIAAVAGTAVVSLVLALYYRLAAQFRTSGRSLRDAEARITSIVESAMDAIITVDEDERVVLFNKAAEAVFGWSREEALGAPLANFIPARFRAAHSTHIRRFADTDTASRRMSAQRIVTGLRRSGVEFPIDASISQVTEHGKRLFTVILRDVTERVRADEALLRSRQELREFAAAASSAREQEKQRVARELHDELAQTLTALKMDLARLAEEQPAAHGHPPARISEMHAMLDNAVKSTRRIAADLRPLMLDDLGLIPAVEWLMNNFTQRTGIQCDFDLDPLQLELREPYATAVFRILQESLANVAKHARATVVEVALYAVDGRLTLRVRDNGCGFDPGAPRNSDSFGLVGLRERAYLLDGELTVDAAPGKGVAIEVRIPLTPAKAAT